MSYKINVFTGLLDRDTGASAEPQGQWGSPSSVTISGGVAALSGEGYYLIDTETGASTDDLDKLTGLANGDEVLLGPADDARTVVLKAGAFMKIGTDFSLDSQYDRIKLLCVGSDVCVELSRASNG